MWGNWVHGWGDGTNVVWGIGSQIPGMGAAVGVEMASDFTGITYGGKQVRCGNC